MTLLNDPTFVEAARALAERTIAQGPANDAARVDSLFQLVLGRPPRDAERSSLMGFLGLERARFEAQPEQASELLAIGASARGDGAPAELAAWTALGRVVLNLHETITRY